MEQHLPGGFVTTVVRAGDTVRRTPPANAAFVHDLLRYLERRGWAGAPRFLGIDDQGREVLSYLEGRVPWGPATAQPAAVASTRVRRRGRRPRHDPSPRPGRRHRRPGRPHLGGRQPGRPGGGARLDGTRRRVAV